jgi:hypothetical protein
VVGALVWDLVGSTARFPWWTAGAVAALFASRWIPLPDAMHGWITLVFCAACAVLLLTAEPRRPAPLGPGGGGSPGGPQRGEHRVNGRCPRLSLPI